MIFPAITLWQPYASLIFTRHKRHETRGFRLPPRLEGQMVAIHSAKRPMDERKQSPELSGLARSALGTRYVYDLPMGAVLGFVRFGPAGVTDIIFPRPRKMPLGGWSRAISHEDEAAGDWAPGRWAWPIIEVFKLDEPIPAKGSQGFWRFAMSQPPILVPPHGQ